MAAGSIVVDLLMKTGSFETDTARAERRMRKFEKEAVAVGKAVAAAGVAVAGAMAVWIKSSINAMDEMGKMAQKAGVAVESLSALAHAANLSGVSKEQLTSSLVRLTKGMSDAAQGTGEAEKAFRALNITVKNADGTLKSTDELLLEVADKFAGFKDGAEKTALAVAIFGRAGADMIPMLNQGSKGLRENTEEARRLGLVMSTDAAKAAEQFNDNITRLKSNLAGLGIEMGTVVLKYLVPLTDNLRLARDAGLGFAESLETIIGQVFTLRNLSMAGPVNIVRGIIGGAIAGLSEKSQQLANARKTVDDIQKQLAELPNRRMFWDYGGGARQREEARLREELGKAQKFVLALEAQYDAMERAQGVSGFDAPMGGTATTPAPRLTPTTSGGGAAAQSISDAERMIQNLRDQAGALSEQIRLRRDLTALDQVNLDMWLGKYPDITADEEKRLRLMAEAVDMRRNDLGLQNELALIEKERKQTLDEMLDLAQGIDARVLQQRRAMGILSDAFEAGKISAEQFKDAATAYLGLVNNAVVDTTSFAREMGMAFSSAFEDAILSGKKFSDVLKGLLRDIAAIAFRRNVTVPLGGLMTDAIKNAEGGGFWASIGKIFSGGGANGVATQPGRSYLVGENGPEMFVPNTAGKVMPGNDGTTVISAPQIQVNVINNTGTQVQSSQRTRQDGGITQIDVMLETIEGGLARKVQSGSGPLSDVLAKQFGINRAAGAMI